MKLLRLLAFAIATTAWFAGAAFAGDGAKAAHGSCGTKAAATTANAACCAKTTATTAHASCGTKATAATNAACTMTVEECQAMMAAGGCTAEMQAACAAHGTKSASAGKCGMHATAGHADCAVCAGERACDESVAATGARSQVVALRNGAMIVYVLDGDENVRALQASVARHNARVVAALQGDAKLCSACKKLRGALASGKLVREVVNVERGCQLLITSSDRSIVQQVHECKSAQFAARTKI